MFCLVLFSWTWDRQMTQHATFYSGHVAATVHIPIRINTQMLFLPKPLGEPRFTAEMVIRTGRGVLCYCFCDCTLITWESKYLYDDVIVQFFKFAPLLCLAQVFELSTASPYRFIIPSAITLVMTPPLAFCSARPATVSLSLHLTKRLCSATPDQ